MDGQFGINEKFFIKKNIFNKVWFRSKKNEIVVAPGKYIFTFFFNYFHFILFKINFNI